MGRAPRSSPPSAGSVLLTTTTNSDESTSGDATVTTAITSEAQAVLVSAEYSALRAEIGRYQDHQRQLINSVFLVIGGSLTIAGKFATNVGSVPLISAPKLLIFVPPVYALLALLYLDRAVRIIRLAHYLHDRARPRASSVAGVGIWEWESYKRETSVVSRRLAIWLDKLRWGVFILPLAVTAIVSSLLPGVSWWYRIASAVVGIVSLSVTVGAALVTEETTGAGTMTSMGNGTVQ